MGIDSSSEELAAERDALAGELNRLRNQRDAIDKAIKDHDRDEHLKSLDIRITDANHKLDEINKRLSVIEAQREKEGAIQSALEIHLTNQEKSALSTRTLWLMTFAIIVPAIITILVKVL